jgi:hypothetical protein
MTPRPAPIEPKDFGKQSAGTLGNDFAEVHQGSERAT